ncbi:MAG TPA: PAS domain-containing protein [Rhizomicrobium sp.]|nr:PAS domain-containing protein [Rhizomicrobium sp.]
MLAQQKINAVLNEDLTLREVFEQVASPQHEDAQELTSYWRERETDGGFVVGKDIPSRRLASILRNISLAEPVGNSRNLNDLRIRLAGDAFRQRFGRDTGGARLSDLFDHDDFEAHITQVGVALHRGAPYIIRCALRRGAVVDKRYEVVVLPVWSADRTARWVLTGIFYFA